MAGVKLPPAVKVGLAKAKKISIACEGVKGTVLVDDVVLPRKAVCQMALSFHLAEQSFMKGKLTDEEIQKGMEKVRKSKILEAERVIA